MTVSGGGSPVLPVFGDNELRTSSEDEVVGELVETLIDDVRGNLTAADRVDDGDLAALLRAHADRRRDRIERLLRTSNLDERDVHFDGTPAGALRRVWMELEGKVADDEAIVKSVVRGEKHTLGECEDALEENLGKELTQIVQRTAADISKAIEVLEARIG